MLVVHTERLRNRLEQLAAEVQTSCHSGLDFYDRLREFQRFCDDTPALAQLIRELPCITFDFGVDWRDIPSLWPGGTGSYAVRWDAIKQMVDGGPDKVDMACLRLTTFTQGNGLRIITDIFVLPISHFLIDHLASSSAVLYALLRYKRWVEWFEADHLRDRYRASQGNGESVLDEDLRRFLFESGIDYPFSQPASPRGRVDIVAGLETNDPLVLEVKVWDSTKGYKEDRVCDGFRQTMDYAAKYGKDRGYVVVFNLDEQPLAFIGDATKGEWPPCTECGGRTYFFVDVHISERLKPISQQDKGKPVRVNEIDLSSLLKNV